ncbi:MAG: bifunctional phosphopantothenoylcysteine decarboxylase/phosphopantothenate--cysteine ligase CoaBC [Bryobacteraceae bacterium]|jgi:phosphopantothenoylcysteine decarboxylase/phosphopantothenate--cysteine ligase
MNAVLGIGGGIAAYKAAELARALIERGVTVQVVMTRAAQEFVRPLTFAALTGRKVITDLFAASGEDTLASAVEHIRVAQEAQALVVAPATADLLAKFANGLADDFLSTLYLAFTGPVVLAPAMNTNMWNHPATRRNLETLRGRGHTVVDPEEGALACGMVGPGRLAEPARIAAAVLALLNRPRDLEGETVLVTAGPTEEPVDPVRFLSNRSSGKMGYAVAEAAAARGARVVLVSGPVHLSPPAGVSLVQVRTAEEMRAAVLEHLSQATIIVKAAAVADYRVKHPAAGKIKKSEERLTLDLEPTPDILAELGALKGERLLVGFAAETGDPLPEARRKLASKHCDMMVGNRVDREGAGFGSDDNEVVLALRTGEAVALPRAPKRDVADRIFDHLLKLRNAS